MALTKTRVAALAALVPAAVALGPVAPAASEDDDDRRPHGSTETFEGTCEFAGTLRQSPPLTNAPQPGRASAVAIGRCTGAVTDSRGRTRQLEGARAGYAAQAEGTTSCAGGNAEGAGFILLRGERIGFRFSEARGPGAGAIRLEGARGGSAAGTARVREDEDPVRIARECGGSGLSQVGIRIDLATTPAISG